MTKVTTVITEVWTFRSLLPTRAAAKPVAGAAVVLAFAATAAAGDLGPGALPRAAAQSATGSAAGSADALEGSSLTREGLDTSSQMSSQSSDSSSLSSVGSSRLPDFAVAPRGSAQLPDSLGSGDSESSRGAWLTSILGSTAAFSGANRESSAPGSSGSADSGGDSSANSAGDGSGSAPGSGGSAGSSDSFANSQLNSPEDRGTDPGVDYGPQPQLLETRHIEGNLYEIDVWSPANGTVITNLLLTPEHQNPRPTLILMSGADGGAGGANWHTATDYESFFADKNVNVVTPIGGGSSMYANWSNPNSPAGKNQWETYLAKELPALVNAEFNGTGRNAIAGLSMSGGPALHIAGNHPETFVAAGSFSGFPATSGIVGRLIVEGVLRGSEGSSVDAFGLSSNDAWQLNDPSYDPALLRGTKVFVGTAYGIPTANELLGDWTWGMGLEFASQVTSNYFTRVARAAGVDVERYHTTFGAHTYELFERELHVAWDKTLGPALQADQEN